MDVMSKGDFLSLMCFDESFCEAAAECGQKSFIIMAGAFDGCKVKSEKLSYEGPFGVGYGVCSFRNEGRDDERCFLEKYKGIHNEKMSGIKKDEDEYVRLARESLESYIKNKKKIEVPDGASRGLTERRAGAFVSLKKDGNLRGCIGTIGPTKDSLALEIIENAISAAVRDPRFQPVREDELQDLVYSVDVLSEPEDIESEDELDVKKYGVIVTARGKRGLLLPNLEGVDTVRDQINIAKQKAGIEEYEPVEMQRFQVVRHR